MASRRSGLRDHFDEMLRLYVEDNMSLNALAERFKVGPRRLSKKLRESGVTIRPNFCNLPDGQTGRQVCVCGKPIYLESLCLSHYRRKNYGKRRRYDRCDEIKEMCSRLESVQMERSPETIGVVAVPTRRKTRYGRNVTYFWQGSHDRSPEWARRLGSVPERVSMRASRMLLKVLRATRKRVSDGKGWGDL